MFNQLEKFQLMMGRRRRSSDYVESSGGSTPHHREHIGVRSRSVVSYHG